MSTAGIQTNSKYDLVLERVIDVPRELVWASGPVRTQPAEPDSDSSSNVRSLASGGSSVTIVNQN